MTLSISDAMSSAELFGPSFAGESWATWTAVLKATFGEPMSEEEIDALRSVAERDPPPGRVSEAVYIVGRGGGKDSVASFVATWFAVFFDPRGKLRPGERGIIMIIACDRRQAAVAFGFVKGYFETIPALAAMVESMDVDSISLNNSVTIEVHTNSFRAVRGRSIICAIFDEVAFWRDESSASPDVEVHGAVLPGLGRVSGSMLILISTPYKRSGLLFDRWRDCYGREDEDTLVVVGSTTTFNPTFDTRVIAKAMERDPVFFAAEYFCEWRSDISGFLDSAWVDRAATLEAGELPYRAGVNYVCFIDPSGGRVDAMAMSIGHLENGRVIIDVVRGRKAPFEPSSVVLEFVEVMRRYQIRRATSDRYAAEWVVSAFAEYGITIEASERSKSEIYLESEKLFAEGSIAIPNDRTVLHELRSLERRTHRGGRDSVDHPVGGRDDHANALCGAAALAAGMAGGLSAGWRALINEIEAEQRVPLPAAPRVAPPPTVVTMSQRTKDAPSPPLASESTLSTPLTAPAPAPVGHQDSPAIIAASFRLKDEMRAGTFAPQPSWFKAEWIEWRFCELRDRGVHAAEAREMAEAEAAIRPWTSPTAPSNDTVLMRSPKALRVMLNHYQSVIVPAGVSEQPASLAGHSYLKANGVTIIEAEV